VTTASTPVAPTVEQVRTRTLAALERAQTDLKSIDLRSLKGDAKDAVKEARAWTSDAITAVKKMGQE
jgi:hypothetical protein